MDYSRIINEFKNASIFDLYRMSIAIKNEMESPRRITEIRNTLIVGQNISYFDRIENSIRHAKLIQKNMKYVIVLDLHNNAQWRIPYYLLNIEYTDTKIRNEGKKLDKNTLSVGDIVGFNSDGQINIGKIVRLNFKTVTLITNENKQWRVSYSLLFDIVDVKPSHEYLDYKK